MRGPKIMLWIVFALFCASICASLSEAGRFRAVQPGCAGGACAVSAEQLPASDVLVARGWPWSKPPAPAPTPAPPVVQPVPPALAGGEVVESTLSAEVRHPVARTAKAVARVAAVPLRLAGKAAKAVVGHQRRAERRAARGNS